ncbi:MAG: hypothetical protein ACKO91_01875 [Acidimicrobiales bacterium]
MTEASGRMPAERRPAPHAPAGSRAAPGGAEAGPHLAGLAPGLPASPLRLQRLAGNRSVAAAVRKIVQRVEVAGVATGETLYNQPGANGAAAAASYSIDANYEMNRNGDSGVTVNVRIKFLSQVRNAVPPPPGVAGAPPLGALIGNPVEIPAADARRAWAQTTAASALTHWANRLTLIGEEFNFFSANTRKRLPVTFQATPVFGLNDPAHNTVIVHPSSVVGGSPGNPIDAGNYYVAKDAGYPANDDIIYAHEYGHLLGIADEYSQSNEQMNALLHQAAPGGAASAMAALDRTTVERMVLAAMSRPLHAQLVAAIGPVTDAIRAQRAAVKRRMGAAARQGAVDPAVQTALTAALAAVATPGLAPSIPGIVAFQTTTNFSNLERAGEGVEAGFSAAALTASITNAYGQALLDPQATNVAVAGLGDVRVNMTRGMYAAAGPGSPVAGSAAVLAGSTVGAVGPGLPAVPPPATLAGQLAALPGTWSAAGGVIETGVTGPAFAAKMAAAISGAAAAQAEAAAALPPGVAAPAIGAAAPLYRQAYELVANTARTASQEIASGLVAAAVQPVLTSSVASFQSAIQAEVTRIMATPPGGLAAAGAPDPNMTAMVNAMKARLDAAKAATAGSGRDPLGAGTPAPDQDVTYSYQGLMGPTPRLHCGRISSHRWCNSSTTACGPFSNRHRSPPRCADGPPGGRDPLAHRAADVDRRGVGPLRRWCSLARCSPSPAIPASRRILCGRCGDE